MNASIVDQHLDRAGFKQLCQNVVGPIRVGDIERGLGGIEMIRITRVNLPVEVVAPVVATGWWIRRASRGPVAAAGAVPGTPCLTARG